MTESFSLRRGDAPLLVSFPHNGCKVPENIAATMSSVGRASVDSDWHVHALYTALEAMSATVLVAQFSRYVVDLNRAPDAETLYPGRAETALCPLRSFSGQALYAGSEPGVPEIERRRARYWQPYHDALQNELKRLQRRHGHVVLWDAHTIRSEVPMFFDGRLPEFNFGTFDQHSAAPEFGEGLLRYCQDNVPHRAVLNGRFKGGYITRQYGQPQQGVHAIQLELSQALYLRDETEVPPVIEPAKAKRLSLWLEALLKQALAIRASVAAK